MARALSHRRTGMLLSCQVSSTKHDTLAPAWNEHFNFKTVKQRQNKTRSGGFLIRFVSPPKRVEGPMGV